MAIALGHLFAESNLAIQQHDLISLHFLQHIHQRDVGEGPLEGIPAGSILDLHQFVCRNLYGSPACWAI